jgi:hypothetical protein
LRIERRLLPDRRLQQPDVFEQLDRLAVPDVVDAERRRASRRARVGIRRVRGSGLGHEIQHAHHALDDVIDVGEVAPHPAVIEDADRLAGKDRLGEERHRHVRAPPRPIDREETQACGRQTEQMAVRVRHQLVRALGCRV